MDRLIARANIAHFEDLLAHETDTEKRRIIEELLGRERQKLEIAERKADVIHEPVARANNDRRTYPPNKG